MDKTSTSRLARHELNDCTRARRDRSAACRRENGWATSLSRLIAPDWIRFGWATTTTRLVISKPRRTETRGARMPGCKLVIAKLSWEKTKKEFAPTSTRWH